MNQGDPSAAFEQLFSVEPATWLVDGKDLQALREQVFIVEQAIHASEEWDAFDGSSQHVLARDSEGRPIGCGRLTPEHKIGRMAVLAAWRGRGVGAALLRVLVEQARARGTARIELHAQVQAQAFYEKAGFEAIGDAFDECGIAHRVMWLALEPLVGRTSAPVAPAPIAQVLMASDRVQAIASIATLLAMTHHEIALLSRDLDPALLDVPDVLDAFKRIALSGRLARIRMLVLDPRKAIVDGHRLIALAQRLPGAVSMRTPIDPRDLGQAASYLLNDQAGYFLRPLGSRSEGEGSTYAPGRHAQLLAQFNQAWERAVPCGELRVLGI